MTEKSFLRGDLQLTPELVQQAIRECVAVVRPGDILVIRVSRDAQAGMFEALSNHAEAVSQSAGIGIMVVVGDELGVFQGGEGGGPKPLSELTAAELPSLADIPKPSGDL